MENRIVAAIGWLGTALVFVALGIKFGMPAQDRYATYFAYAGLVSLLIYAAGQWREIAGAFGRRQTRYGALTSVSVLIVLGILGAVNYLGKNQNKRWDMTQNKQFSLSDQSRNILQKLDAPLQIMVFAQEPDFGRYKDRLREYEYSSKRVSTEYVDPDKKRAVAQQNQIQAYGTILFNYKGRSERITTDTEQDITNGIIKVTTGRQKKVFFTQGHGEKDTTNSERAGYATLAGGLGRENYTVEKLVLAQQSSVPEDAAVVIVAGPKVDFLEPETEALRKYLAKSGKLLLELDPPEKPDSQPLTNLKSLAHEWGIDVSDSVVVDASGMGRLIGTDASVPVAASYPPHPISDRFNLMTAYPLARAIVPVPGGVNGHTAQPFVESSPQSWAETDLAGLLTTGKVTMDPTKGDKPGPIVLAAAVSAPSAATPAAPSTPGETPETPAKSETRVVVFGDSDFATNAGLGIQGNRDIFMNAVGWLSQQENLIAIRPKDPTDRRLVLTAAQQTNLAWLSLLLIPGAIVGAGIYSWTRRR
jgi:ABC-type uncharacterized transport system involved in gliding motility auxiliary subunit